jgi:hypothetical protein
MRDPQTKIINGNEWVTYPWHGMLGLKIQARLAKVVAPALLTAEGSGDFKALAHSITDLLDEESAPKFIVNQLLHGTKINGREISNEAAFNDHFSANFSELYQGLAFIFKVNFEDFTKLADVFIERAQSFASRMKKPEPKLRKNTASYRET